MKTSLFLLILLSCSLLSAASAASPVWDIVTPLVLLIASPLIIRLFKKLGIDISNDALDPILIKIIELIAKIEQDNPDETGQNKKSRVVSLLPKLLSARELKLLMNRFGSLSAAVQAAFEKSALSLK